jgi:hypothetical protein
MTADVIRWPWQAQHSPAARLQEATAAAADPQPSPPNPMADLTYRLAIVEQAMQRVFDDREVQAGLINDLNARISEQDRMIIRLQEQNANQQHHADGLTASLIDRVAEINRMHGRLETSERSRERQGERIGALERQVEMLPRWKDLVLKAQLSVDLWQRYVAQLRGLLVEAGVIVPEPPQLPDIPPLESVGDGNLGSTTG